VLGHRDPDIFKLKRASPTPQTASIYIFLLISGALKWEIEVGDASTAFMQTRPEDGARIDGDLYSEMPPEGIPLADGTWVPEGSLLRLNTAVYGLVNAPSAWRRTLVNAIEDLGYRRSAYEPCIFALMDKKGPQGHVLIEIDDLFTMGDKVHKANMAKLRKTFRFGKWLNIYGSETDFAGRTVCQNKDYSCDVHQAKFIMERLHPIVLPRGRFSDKTAVTTDQEKTQLKVALGATNWLQRETRPDASATSSILLGKVNKSTIQQVSDCNAMIKDLKATPKLGLHLPAIPLHQIKWAVIQDASWANCADDNSQGGFMVGATTDELFNNKPAPFSIVSYKSHKLPRTCSSTLAAEAQ
jgi:hypothetical protein